jgi:hypothetical protein
VRCNNCYHGNAIKDFLLYNLFILAGGFSFSVKGFRAIWDDIYDRRSCNAVKGFWALWDNICACVFTALDFSPFLTGNLLVLT